MVASPDGSASFKNENITGDELDQVVCWHGTSLPSGAGNDVPQNGIFLLESLDGSSVIGIYKQTSATKSSPSWQLILRNEPNYIIQGADFADPFPAGKPAKISTLTALLYAVSQDPNEFRNASDDVLRGWQDNFTSYANDSAFDAVYPAIAGTDVNPNATNDRIDFTIDNSGNNSHGVYWDYGSSITTENFLLRFKIVFTTVANNTTSNQDLHIGLSDIAGAQTSNQDFLGFNAHLSSGSTKFRTTDANGVDLSLATNTNFATATLTTGTFWVEIKRTSMTAYSVTIYSDEYVTAIETVTPTISGGYTGFRYLKIYSTDVSTATGNLTGYIENIEFYRGITALA